MVRYKDCCVIVILDSLRYDTGAMAWKPQPLELQNMGFSFLRGRSPWHWTLPSHASMMSGKRPEDAVTDTREVLKDNPLGMARKHAKIKVRDGIPWLDTAEPFNYYDKHYLFSGNALLTPLMGFDKKHWKGGMFTAPDNPRSWYAMRQLLEIEREDNHLLFWNIMDTHYNWGLNMHTIQSYPYNQDPINFTKPGLGEPMASFMKGAQAAQAATAFEHVVEVLSQYEDPRVVITSDHGEYFGEHGFMGHDCDVWRDDVLHDVPLILDPVSAKKFKYRSRSEPLDVTRFLWEMWLE